MNPLLKAPWYYGWNIVAAGIAAQAIIVGIALYSFTFWIAHWTEDFGVTRAQAMTAFMVLQMASALFSPFAGRALDKFPIRYLMLISAASFAGALALSAIASSFWQILAIYGVLMVVGMVLGGTIPAAALVARWFDRRRGMAMGISTIGTSLGGLILPPVVAYLQLAFGWRDANLVLAVMSLATISLAALVVFNSPDEAGTMHEGAKNGAAGAIEVQRRPDWTTPDVLKSRPFWAIGISFLSLSFAFIAVQQNLAPMGEDFGMNPSTISWFISVMALVMIFSKLGFGYLADRFQYKNVLTVVLMLIASSVAILAFFEISEFTLLVAVIVLGTGMGGVLPLMGVIVADVFGPASFGRMNGLLVLIMLPASLGAVVAASVYDMTGSYQWAWIILLLILAPAALFIRGITNGTAMVRGAKEQKSGASF